MACLLGSSAGKMHHFLKSHFLKRAIFSRLVKRHVMVRVLHGYMYGVALNKEAGSVPERIPIKVTGFLGEGV
jgi:hypothetical protein